MPKCFGRTIRELRLKAGLSQIQLAEKADLNFNFIGSIERGEKLASIETVIRLARGLGLSGADLLRQAGL
ncbi:MAG: helix-turn-helix transcriptional regulator [Dechloromonas sp.]|nr:MAG: helix-turn-helix transcriptional regulator [Dechloromonas sp.]